jgi:hypothetical protein
LWSGAIAALLMSACAGEPERAPHQPVPGADTAEHAAEQPQEGAALAPPAGTTPSTSGAPATTAAPPRPKPPDSFLAAFLDAIATDIGDGRGIVAVFPALTPHANSSGTYVNGLGELLMDETSKGLEARGVSTVAGPGLKNDLLAKGSSASAYAAAEDAYPLGTAIGADYIVFGTVEYRVFDTLKRNTVLHVDWYCERLRDRQQVAAFREDLADPLRKKLYLYFKIESRWRETGNDGAGRQSSGDNAFSRSVDRGRLALAAPAVSWPEIAAPAPQSYGATVPIPAKATPVSEGATAQPIAPGSRVVIGVPATESEVDAQGTVFRTKGYFNHAEQYLEMVLTRRGLRVVDRVAFEAKLRSIIEAKGGQWNPAMDMAELFRLAAGEDLGADYLLQIERFRVGVGEDRVFDLRLDPSYRALLQTAPGVQLPGEVRLPGFSADLRAKMIATADGTIVWNGRCEADLQHALEKDLAVEVKVDRSWEDTQSPSRDELARQIAAANADLDAARQPLDAAYGSGDRQRIQAAEVRFDAAQQNVARLAAAAQAYQPRWTARDQVHVTPASDLVSRSPTADDALQKKLAELVARSLLDTLAIEGESKAAALAITVRKTQTFPYEMGPRDRARWIEVVLPRAGAARIDVMYGNEPATGAKVAVYDADRAKVVRDAVDPAALGELAAGSNWLRIYTDAAPPRDPAYVTIEIPQ